LNENIISVFFTIDPRRDNLYIRDEDVQVSLVYMQS